MHNSNAVFAELEARTPYVVWMQQPPVYVRPGFPYPWTYNLTSASPTFGYSNASNTYTVTTDTVTTNA